MKRVLALTVAAAVLIAAGYAAGQQTQKPAEVRRVVTTIDKTGKAVVLFDSAIPMKTQPVPVARGDIWMTQSYPIDFSWTDDPVAKGIGLHPSKNGTIFRMVDFMPTKPDAISKMPP